MSLTRTQLEQYNKISFNEKVQFVLDLYNERINYWNKFSFILLKGGHNIQIAMFKSIRDYLAAYLTKNTDNYFETLLASGYQKYDYHSCSDYIPTLDLCKEDPLSINDLDCAMNILKKSLFLSNDDFIKEIEYSTNSKYSLTQFAINANSFEVVEGFKNKNDTLSNGFKYYLEGILLEQKKQWMKLFYDCAYKPEHADLGVANFSGMILLGGGLFSYFSDNELSDIALILAGVVSSSLAYMHGAISDNIAVTFFSNRSNQEEKAREIISDTPNQKQHISPYHCY